MVNSNDGSVQKQLQRLSDVQRDAAIWGDGALLVLAGPGSGKTSVLTTRIARLLDTTPEKNFRILALTFTTRAADEMRSRIQTFVPNSDDRLFVGTFHSFCAEQLRQHGRYVNVQGDFRIYSTHEDRIELVQEALRALDPDTQAQEALDARKALPAIDWLKGKLIGPESVHEYFRDKSRAELLRSIYESYEAVLRKYNALDFNSLIMLTEQLFRERPQIAKRVRKTYPYWCLDEFQDTNGAQYTLVQTLAASTFKNVFVVADDDQIIYQWNGASYKRLEQFSRDFSPEVIQLPTNFRCPPQIVDLANRLVSHNSLRSPGKRPLEAGRTSDEADDSMVRLLRFGSDIEEAQGVVADIEARNIAPLGNIAILARTRRMLQSIERAGQQAGLRVRIVQRRDEFQSPHYSWLSSCLKQSNSRGDRRIAEKMVAAFNEVSDLGIEFEKLVVRAESSHGDLLRAWLEELEEIDRDGAYESVRARVNEDLVRSSSYKRFCRHITTWFREQEVTGTSEKEAAFFDDVDAWNGLWREIQGGIDQDAPLEVFLQELDLRSKEPPLRDDTVALMTIHGSKGNEFPHVYLCGLVEDVLPSFHSKKKGDASPELEEERRNCFVAITRAKETLTMSYAGTYSNWQKAPSRFLEEMCLI